MAVVVSMGSSSQTSPDFWSVLVVLSMFPLGMSLEGNGGKTV